MGIANAKDISVKEFKTNAATISGILLHNREDSSYVIVGGYGDFKKFRESPNRKNANYLVIEN